MIGKRLKELRIRKGLSQEELGSIIGVTKVSICGYENNTRFPSLDNLIKLANTLETTTDYLLGREIAIKSDENNSFIGAISHEDILFIAALRHYPTLYARLLKDPTRSANVINKKIN